MDVRTIKTTTVGARMARPGGVAIVAAVVIMLIAVGHLPEELMVARSERKGISEILIRRSTVGD